MLRENPELVYESSMTRYEFTKVLKAIGVPVALFGLALFTIAEWQEFGTVMICPFASVTWVVGVIVAALMPSQRNDALNSAEITLASYFFALLGLKIAIRVVSGASPEMISASFGQPIPMATGNAMTGFLQNALYFVAAGLPISNIIMQVKRFLQFRKTMSIQKAFGRERGIRNTRQDHINTQ